MHKQSQKPKYRNKSKKTHPNFVETTLKSSL